MLYFKLWASQELQLILCISKEVYLTLKAKEQTRNENENKAYNDHRTLQQFEKSMLRFTAFEKKRKEERTELCALKQKPNSILNEACCIYWMRCIVCTLQLIYKLWKFICVFFSTKFFMTQIRFIDLSILFVSLLTLCIF